MFILDVDGIKQKKSFKELVCKYKFSYIKTSALAMFTFSPPSSAYLLTLAAPLHARTPFSLLHFEIIVC